MSAVTDRFCERKSEPTIRATRSPRLAEEQNEQSLFRSFPTLPSPCDCDRANKAPEGLGWGNTGAKLARSPPAPPRFNRCRLTWADALAIGSPPDLGEAGEVAFDGR